MRKCKALKIWMVQHPNESTNENGKGRDSTWRLLFHFQ